MATEHHGQDRLSPEDVATLARLHGRLVFGTAFRMLGDAALAEDVQQDVFLRLLERPAAAVKSWPAYLTVLATRIAIDRLRRRNRWRRLEPLWRVAEPLSAASAEDEVMQLEKAERLRREIARLRPREAACFTLRCIQGLDVAQIAALTGISTNHVAVCLHRATRTLESRLSRLFDTLPETHT